MSDYGRLQDENTALKAENEKLKAELAAGKAQLVQDVEDEAASHKKKK